MKELTEKEKAQRYDKILKVANKYKDTNIMFPSVQDEMFPELREPEDTDEKVRKALIKLVTNHASMDLFIEYDIHLDEALAWLEKQGEKAEPIEGFDTEFERQISRFIASIANKEYEYTEGFVKWASNSLLKYAKHEIEKQGEQKSAWSEKDEINSNICIRLMRTHSLCDKNIITWFKSLKYRIQPQNTWKPSDEQITWLYRAADDASKDSRMKQVLNNLLSDLKKLREK